MSEEYLEHFGVKGMKWGIRRAQKKSDKLAGKIKKLSNERDEVLDIRGIVSRKNLTMSRQLNLLKAKKALQDAKAKGNESDINIAKQELTLAKNTKKVGIMDYDARRAQKMYGTKKHRIDSTLATRIELLEIAENEKRIERNEKVKRTLKKMPSMTLNAVAGTLAFSYGYCLLTGKFPFKH